MPEPFQVPDHTAVQREAYEGAAREMARERDQRYEQLKRAEAERDHLRRTLVGLLPFARGNQHVLDTIHAALDWRPEGGDA